MNALRMFGIAIYSAGFTYAFGETFVQIATKQNEKLRKLSPTRISSSVEKFS
jgi:hypothetical protein